ncbi:MAG TPA: hypothetical protein VL443_06410 [Cyclobacteriaceae bacterium]|jgi:hypothetical protein|nr:hypothetical protein [Cyclobacteriaceae bacterium]
MTLAQKQALFAQNVATLLQYIHSKNYLVTFGEAFRTAEQAQLDAKKGIGIADSLHCKRLAVDLNLLTADGLYITDPKEYEQFGIYWETLHPLNRNGRKFKRGDANHFEMQDL